MLSLLFVATTINYVDRSNLSIVAPFLSKELGLDPVQMGMLFSALDIVESATASLLAVETVARVYFALGTQLRLHWLRDQILALPAIENPPSRGSSIEQLQYMNKWQPL